MVKAFNIKTKLKNILNEADGDFTSVLKNTETFDPTKNINFETDDIAPEENDETKAKLTAKAVDKIKQSLTVTDELQSILNQINKINNEDGYAEWKINEEGNTASLRKKNAYIFKQNDNLCLSYNGKIQIFKSVDELHNWLKENNFPLPKDIKLHEGTEYKSQLHPWHQLQFINGNVGSGSWIFKKAHEIYNSFEYNEISEERAKELLGKLVYDVQIALWGDENGKITPLTEDEKPKNIGRFSKFFEDPVYLTKDGKEIKKGDTVPWTDKDKEELERYNNRFKSTIYKMGKDREKQARQYMTKDDLKLHAFTSKIDNQNKKWYLKLKSKVDNSENQYLSSNWKNGDLLVNNLNDAKSFESKSDALKAYHQVLLKTENPSIYFSPISECFGGVTTGTLGTAVQYVGNKKESSFKDEFLKLLDKKTDDITLKEDDTPEDFATNIDSTPDMPLDDVESPMNTETPDLDMNTDIPSNDAPDLNFGDISISGGNGNYGPEDTEENPMPSIPQDEYKIIDVLINDTDETDIKVKLQNMETGEIEIKELSEIDI